MSGNPSYQQFGVEAMGSCFVSNSSMISPEAPFFHPNVPQDGGGLGIGFGGADIAEHLTASNMVIAASPVCAAPLHDGHRGSMSPEEMNDAYDVAGESCNTVHSMLPTACPVDFQYGPADVVTIAQPSKMGKLAGEPQCSWLYDAPSAAPPHEPFYLTGFFSGAGFQGPLAATGELSLRLGAKFSTMGTMNLADQCSEVSCSGLTHANSEGFGHQQIVKVQVGAGMLQPPYAGAAGSELRQVYHPQMLSSRPLHFSQVLSRSGYAHITQEMLNAVVGCLLKDVAEATDSVSGIGSEASLLLSSSCSTVSSNQLMLPSEEHPHEHGASWMEAQKLRSDLLKLLQLMDQKCNQFFDEVQSTTSRFSRMVHHPGGGAGSSISAPFVHRAVSAMHRRLRKRIMGRIMAAAQRPSAGESSSSLAEKERSWESSFIQKHWALQQLRRGDQQSWRPQRGLPEKSVAVLKAWMFENFLRPYPKDNEKEMLAARSGLSRSQVSNWFINARVRLWKPMIEEMYEELKKTSGGSDEGVGVEHQSSKDVIS